MKLIFSLIAVVTIVLAVQPDVAWEADTTPSAQLREQMRLMKSQMDQIRDAQDPRIRQRLLQKHWTAMQEMSATLQGG